MRAPTGAQGSGVSGLGRAAFAGLRGRGTSPQMCMGRSLVGLTYCSCYLASYITNKVRPGGRG